MKRFAALLEQLVFTNSRNEKLRHLQVYFRDAPDPDRGLGLAAIAGTLVVPNVTPSVIRKLVERQTDPELFRLSYDYVGDLAETTSLIWPMHGTETDIPLHEAVAALQSASRATIGNILEDLLDALDQPSRFALLKLATGGLRIGVSARLAKIALAQFGSQPVEIIEELWFGLEPPYEELFRWLDGKAAQPVVDRTLLFRPVMLAHPLDESDPSNLNAADFVAEWKWDGIRVQAVSFDGERRLYTRTGEDIGHSFPDVLATMAWDGVLDGELLVVREGEVQPFDQLQKRLGRKAPTPSFMADFPAHIRAYDLLEEPGVDHRALSFEARRRRLDAWYDRHRPRSLDLSEQLNIVDWSDLKRLRETCRTAGLEGLMLKNRHSPYLAGRVKGHWFKWKRDPLSADCVLMYAQRGHGKRSSYYSDFTFGCWQEIDGKPTLVPVGKAYSGYTDQDLLKIDKFIRDNTVDRFGPVRAVKPGLVLEVAFDDIHPSSRHKSGLAMRFPRIKRIRWDKPAQDADRLNELVSYMT